MKKNKIISAIAYVALSAMLLTGCASTNKEAAVIANLSDADLLQYLEDNSSYDNYFGDCGYMTQDDIAIFDMSTCNVYGPNYYRLDRGAFGFRCTHDNVRYGIDIYPQYPKVYGIFDEELLAYRINSETISDHAYRASTEETIVSREVKNGKLYLATKYLSNSSEAEYYSDYGLDLPENTEIIDEMVYDIASKRIISGKKQATINGEQVMLSKHTRTFSKEMPKKVKKLQEELEQQIWGSNDTHTITIIVGKGTDREKEYKATANSDVYFEPWIRDVDGKYTMYLDAEYTEEFTGADENGLFLFDTDRVLYMK